ncbi:hypothetical protein GCM10010260_21400 [Streptomyces filipinensis]|uniref:Uncharacterized protein n=1 Tax=Streptomyces filipinensis TaxID=66887 RepID=A0A918M9H7_9ACTN|nr:hypothetical protein GCM10010260_21400 [Streptomyces filipinensis]
MAVRPLAVAGVETGVVMGSRFERIVLVTAVKLARYRGKWEGAATARPGR